MWIRVTSFGFGRVERWRGGKGLNSWVWTRSAGDRSVIPVLPAPVRPQADRQAEEGATGAKRKSRPPASKYDLSDLRRGKGTASDPVSFFELAEGSTLRCALADKLAARCTNGTLRRRRALLAQQTRGSARCG